MKRNPLVLIFAFVFIDLLGYSLFLPLLPYYADTLAANPLWICLLIASNALAQLHHRGLFRGHPAKPYYEAIDGVGHLLYALVQLHETQEARAAAGGKKRFVVLGRSSIDNW